MLGCRLRGQVGDRHDCRTNRGEEPACGRALSAEERLEKVELLWAEERVRNQRQVTDMNAEAAQLKETINAPLRDFMEQGRVGEQERIQRAVAATEDELRQLKSTANALRDQLEIQKASETERTQRAIAEASAENAQLKAAINVLRDELERQKAGEAERTQRALADAAAEVAQLKGSIHALRSQLDARQATAHA